jgi:hypothetical protein
VTNEFQISLKDLEDQARAAIERKNNAKTTPKPVSEPVTPEPLPIPTTLVPIEELPMVEKSKGGGHLAKEDSEDLNQKDLEILSMLSLGADKTTIAALMDVDRKTIYRLLNSGRVDRLTKGAKKLVSSLAPLAAELLRSEIAKGNIEVAQAVLKGLNIMRASVNSGEAKTKITSVAEEIVDNDGKTTKRVIRSRETND